MVKKRNKKARSILYLNILCIVLLALIVNAGEWDSYGKDERSTGRVGDATGQWTSDAGTPITLSGESPDYQPIAINLSGDLAQEIIYSDGNFLRAVDSSGNVQTELNFGSTITSPITAYDNGTSKKLLFINSTHFNSRTYNGTAFNEVCNAPVEFDLGGGTNTSIGKNVKCSIDNANICFFLNDAGNICETNTITCGMTCNTGTNSSAIGNFTAALGILTGSGNEMFISKTDSNSFLVYDVDAANLFTSFDGDGLLDVTTAGIFELSNPVIYNYNNVGDSEVIFNYVQANAGTTVSQFYIYRSDGTALGASPFTYHTIANTGGTTHVSDPIIALTSSDIYTCGYAHSTIHNNVSCLENDLSTYVYFPTSNMSVSGGAAAAIQANMFSADMTGDGNDEIVMPNGIWSITGSFLYNFGSEDNINIIGHDFQNNGDIGVFIYGTTLSRIYYSNFTNSVPTLYNNLSRGGYGSNLGFDSPICLNSTVTFSAQECGGTVTDCNYDNDGANDQERMVSNCGQQGDGTPGTDFTSNLADGTFTLAAPAYQCVFNNTGVFNIRLYLEDDENTGDRTQFNTETISLQVIDGVAGVTCNMEEAVGVADEAIVGDPQVDSDVDATLGILLGTSTTLKLIVGLALIIGTIVMVAQHTQNGMAIAVSGMAILFITTFLGLIPASVVILFMLGIIFIVLVGKFFIGSNTDS